MKASVKRGFAILVVLAFLAAPARAGDAPMPPETTLEPARAGWTPTPGSAASPQPSARVTVALPGSGGQAEIRASQNLSPQPPVAVYRQASAQPWTSESYSGMGGVQSSGQSSASDALQGGTPEESAARPLALVGGKPITDQDVLQELWARKGRETLDWMVGRAILEQELAALGLSVDDAEVEARLGEHMDGLSRVFPKLANRDELARAASGMGLEEYRERSVWAELALRKVMRETLKPSDEQLRSYFAERRADYVEPDQARISQIFIAPPAGLNGDSTPGSEEWAEAERLIVQAHTRLRMGEDFREVASSYASGATAPRWVERGVLMRELEEAAFSLRPGAMSAPIRTGMGYHIIRVDERRERKLPRFEEVRDQVLADYEKKFFLAAAGEFMTRLREKAVREGKLLMLEDAAVLGGAALTTSAHQSGRE